MTAQISELLRAPARSVERCADPRARAAMASLWLALVLAGGASFGLAAGSFRGPTQALLAGCKVPLATLLALAISGPAFFVLSAVFGRRWDFGTAVLLMLSAGARSSLVLFALAPGLALAVDYGVSYETLRLLALGAYSLGGLSGLSFLVVALGKAKGRAGVLVCFAAVFAAVGAQSAWIFRPFIGDPRDARVPLFAQGRVEGGIVGALLDGRRAP